MQRQASADMVAAVDRLARTTGSNPVPEGKVRRGYRFEREKFGIAGLTPVESETVSPPRVAECHVQLEAVVEAIHELAEDDPVLKGRANVFELRIQRVHVEESVLIAGEPNRIHPDKWRPLIMSFQKFYGMGAQVHPSTLRRFRRRCIAVPTSIARGKPGHTRAASARD